MADGAPLKAPASLRADVLALQIKTVLTVKGWTNVNPFERRARSL